MTRINNNNNTILSLSFTRSYIIVNSKLIKIQNIVKLRIIFKLKSMGNYKYLDIPKTSWNAWDILSNSLPSQFPILQFKITRTCWKFYHTSHLIEKTFGKRNYEMHIAKPDIQSRYALSLGQCSIFAPPSSWDPFN